MRAPAKGTYNMTESSDRIERCIERCAADSIVNNVETAPVGVFGDVAFHRHLSTVDRNCEPFDESLICGRACCEHFGSGSARDLDCDMTDTAGAAMDQHFLPGMHGSAIDQSFPSR